MNLEIDATYENGVLRPDQPLPLQEQERVHVSIQARSSSARAGYGLIRWNGTPEELDRFIEDPEQGISGAS